MAKIQKYFWCWRFCWKILATFLFCHIKQFFFFACLTSLEGQESPHKFLLDFSWTFYHSSRNIFTRVRQRTTFVTESQLTCEYSLESDLHKTQQRWMLTLFFSFFNQMSSRKKAVHILKENKGYHKGQLEVF